MSVEGYHNWECGALNQTGPYGYGGYIQETRKAETSSQTQSIKQITMREALLKQDGTKQLTVEEGKINR